MPTGESQIFTPSLQFTCWPILVPQANILPSWLTWSLPYFSFRELSTRAFESLRNAGDEWLTPLTLEQLTDNSLSLFSFWVSLLISCCLNPLFKPHKSFLHMNEALHGYSHILCPSHSITHASNFCLHTLWPVIRKHSVLTKTDYVISHLASCTFVLHIALTLCLKNKNLSPNAISFVSRSS